MKRIGLASCGIALLSLVACSDTSENGEKRSESRELYSIDTTFLDRSVRPQDDFFQFANGSWIQNNPIPASESRWGSFNELDQENKVKLTAILEAAKESNAPKGSTEQLIGDYYASYINMEARNKEKISFLDEIEAYFKNNFSDKNNLVKVLADLHSRGINAFFSFRIGQDLKDVDRHVAYISQAGIGLPNRDYYDETSEEKKEIIDAYKKHMQQIFELNGSSPDDASLHVNTAFEVENKLASSMMRPAELRIPENTYNPTGFNDLDKSVTNFQLADYLTNRGITDLDTIVVGQSEYIKTFNNLINSLSREEIASYLMWRTYNHYAKHLDEKSVQSHFDFYKTKLSGTKEMKPIEERAINEMTNNAVREALGKAFVEQHFSPAAKDKVNEMVDNLLIVYRERLTNLDWMSDETKVEALNKLDAIGRKLGYPDEWKDLSGLEISQESYIQNVDNCNRFSIQENLDKLGQPVDRSEWGMPAHMVNAYYHPLLNIIAFPAGIMQSPFFDINAEDAVNYGGIGMVIGHEFTHGFDDMGSKFAADGSFTNWWTEEDRKRFEERTGKLGATYESFCTQDNKCVNAQLTMGENIADLGGVTMAYHAYAMTDEYKSGELVNSFTPSQRFFLAYAQLWKISYTPEELSKRLATDPHSPGMYRVNGPLMNSPEFFEAFNVQEGDPMRNTEEEISVIW